LSFFFEGSLRAVELPSSPTTPHPIHAVDALLRVLMSDSVSGLLG
jgi:hypothetical protein